MLKQNAIMYANTKLMHTYINQKLEKDLSVAVHILATDQSVGAAT